MRLPENYFNNVPVLPLRYNLGHPTKNHPVANTVNVKTKTPIAMNCLSCHQPHASAKGGLLAKDQENNMAFCKGCHGEGSLKLQ